MIQISGRARLRRTPLLVLFCVLAASSARPAAAKPTVPDKASLKARVGQLYGAYQSRDQKAMLDLVLPQILQCYPAPDENIFHIWDREDPLRLITWKIRKIRYEGYYVGQVVEFCPGQTLQAAAGAIVSVLQTDQEPGAEPTTDEAYLPWVYVDGTWFFLIDDD